FGYDNAVPSMLMQGTAPDGQPIDVWGLASDGRLVVGDDHSDDGVYRLYALNRANGHRDVLFERPGGGGVSGAILDPWTSEVVGVRWHEGESKQHFFDPALQSAYDRVSATFADGVARFTSWSRDHSHILVYGEHGMDGGAYYVY